MYSDLSSRTCLRANLLKVQILLLNDIELYNSVIWHGYLFVLNAFHPGDTVVDVVITGQI